MESEKLLMHPGEVAGRPVGVPRNYPLATSTKRTALDERLHFADKTAPPTGNIAVKVTQPSLIFDHHESVDSTDSGLSSSSGTARTSGKLNKMVFKQLRHSSLDSEHGRDGGFTDEVTEPNASSSVEIFRIPSPTFDDGFEDDGSMSYRHASFGGITQYRKREQSFPLAMQN
ncbi:hypothetical protein RvY_04526 [Ramazzottius varieornatus]|uniref:Uncharacterized protein n=1 Tax=Ramazzottius varieornatus TaxID=947166 RepID=A0A1D1V1W0_RAMVA|nr:hypothetical protein RvY_04526 [Ramazzottius varieornatus]